MEINPTDRRVFQPHDLLRLIRENVVEMPTIRENDIDDRSKANWVSKCFSLFQVSWFLLQLLALSIQRLAVTPLELYTLSIVVCGVVIYAYEWRKPFDVQQPVLLRAKIVEYSWPEEMGYGTEVPMGGGPNKFRSIHGFNLFATFFVFFACYLIGWNLEFPTTLDQLMWRVGSILCVILPLSMLFIVKVLPLSMIFFSKEGDNTWTDFFIFQVFFYYLVRMILFVEIFKGLLHAPASVYQTPRWLGYLPSFGA